MTPTHALTFDNDDDNNWVDHTNASPFEELVSTIEQTIRDWGIVEGDVDLGGSVSGHPDATPPLSGRLCYHNMQLVLRFFRKSEYDRKWSSAWEDAGTTTQVSDAVHDLRNWFGVNEYLLLFPRNFGSESFAFVDSSVGTTLLSALHLALVNCKCTFPGFVPVHEKSKRSFIGSATLGLRNGGDQIQFYTNVQTNVEPRFAQVEGLIRLFRSKTQFPEAMVSGSRDVVVSSRHAWRVDPSWSTSRKSWHAGSGADGAASPSAHDIGWASWADNDVSWRMDRRAATQPHRFHDARLAMLQGPTGTPLWGPLEDPLHSFTVSAEWPNFSDSQVLQSEMHATLLPRHAPVWTLHSNWYHGHESGILGRMRPEFQPPLEGADSIHPLGETLATMVLLYEDALSLPKESLLCGIGVDSQNELTDTSFELEFNNREAILLQQMRQQEQQHLDGTGRDDGTQPPAPPRRGRPFTASSRFRSVLGGIASGAAHAIQEAIVDPDAATRQRFRAWQTRRVFEMIGELFSGDSLSVAASVVGSRAGDWGSAGFGGAPGNELDALSNQLEHEFLVDMIEIRLEAAREEARGKRRKQLTRLNSEQCEQQVSTDRRGDDEAWDGGEQGKSCSTSNLKSAPVGSMLSVMSLRMVPELGTLPDMANLWVEFVRELRWHWEQRVPIPLDVGASSWGLLQIMPNFACCRLHQKLQVLNTCVVLECLASEFGSEWVSSVPGSTDEDGMSNKSEDDGVEFYDAEAIPDEYVHGDSSGRGEQAPPHDSTKDQPRFGVGDNHPSRDAIRRGVLRAHPNGVNDPVTQLAVLFTEDMIEEASLVLDMLSSAEDPSSNFSRPSELLSSDMRAFKAANSGKSSVSLVDFRRWHERFYHPEAKRGKYMHHLMRVARDVKWEKLWDSAQPRPLYAQHSKHGFASQAEKVLHYLETISPEVLVGQLLPVACASAQFVLGHAKSDAVELSAVQLAVEQANARIAEVCDHELLQSLNHIQHTTRGGMLRTPEQIAQVRNGLQSAVSSVQHAETLLSKATSLLHKLDRPIVETLVRNSVEANHGPFRASFLKSTDRVALMRLVCAEPRVGSSGEGDQSECRPPDQKEFVMTSRTQVSMFQFPSKTAFTQADSGLNRMYACLSKRGLRVALGTSETTI